jgi:hypothetical protein
MALGMVARRPWGRCVAGSRHGNTAGVARAKREVYRKPRQVAMLYGMSFEARDTYARLSVRRSRDAETG